MLPPHSPRVVPCPHTDCLRHPAVQMPQVSAAEMRAAEAEASYTVQQGVAAAVALYLCMRFPWPP